MKYSVDKQERYTVFQIQESNLNSILAPNLKSDLILDLSEVEYVDSSGLSAILTADRLWKRIGTFIITGIEHPSVKKLIEISRLDTILTIVPSVEESIEYVFMEEIEKELNVDGGDEDWKDDRLDVRN